MSWFGDVAGAFGWDNPGDEANQYLSQIQNQLKPYYQKYMDAGSGALSTLQGQYGSLLSNPGQFLNQMGQNYHQSPGFQFNVDQATQGANRAAAAGGMAGSPAEQQSLAKTISGYADQDYNNWMGNALGLYGKGLSGEEGINSMGFSASDQMAQSILAQLMSQAKASFSGAQDQNKLWGDVMGTAFGKFGPKIGF